MKTDDLVAMLASGGGAVDPQAIPRRYTLGLGVGAAAAALLMAVLLGVRHDWDVMLRLPMFWAKLAFVAALAVASVAMALRLSRPGVALGATTLALAAPVIAMWILALVALLDRDAAERMPLVMGSTWRTCPWNIALLSVPVFGAMLWVMKGMAPTRLRAAGAAAGLVAGAVAAVIYSLHCPELAAPFLGFWYLVGILVPTVAGALAGPRLLRW